MTLTYQEIRLEHAGVIAGRFHSPKDCVGEACTIHNRSDHHMRDMRQHWRDDRTMMERICSHGVGHPDPDEYWMTHPFYEEQRDWLGIHGCDGCCRRNDDTDKQ